MLNRFTVFLLFLSLCSISRAQQPVNISYNFKDVPLNDALVSLEKKHALTFAYESSLLDGIRVTAKIKKAPLKEGITHLFAGTPLSFEILEGNQVILRPAELPTPQPNSSKYITGKILDAETGEGLPYAIIVFNDSSGGTVSEGNGSFRLPIKNSQATAIQIRYIGYKSALIPITTKGASQPIVVRMNSSTPLLTDILITGTSDLPMNTSRSDGSVSVNPAKVSSVSVLGEKDIYRALQWAPGISGTAESNEGLIVRGGTADQNLVLLDGINIYNSYHFFGLFSGFNAEALQQVKTYRGGFGAEYGGRVSSVVDITGDPVNPDSLRAGVSLNLLNANAFAKVPLFKKKAALLIAGRRSFNDIIPSPIYSRLQGNLFQSGKVFVDKEEIGEEEAYEVDPVTWFFDVHGKLVVTPGKKDRIATSFYYGSDIVDYGFDYQDEDFIRESRDELKLDNLGASLIWDRQWKDNLSSNAGATYSSYGNKYFFEQSIFEDGDSTSSHFFQNNKVFSIGGFIKTNWEVREKHHLSFGGDFEYITTDLEFDVFGEVDSLELESLLQNGERYTVYAQYLYQPNRKLSVRAGMRGNYYSGTDEFFPEPRIFAQYEPVEGLSLKASWGMYAQFINPVIMSNGFKVGQNFYALAEDEEVPVVQSSHAMVGIAYRMPGFLVEIDAYRKDLWGITAYSKEFDLSTNSNDAIELIGEGEGEVMGFDVLVRKEIGPYTGWVSYTLNQVIQKFEIIDEGNPFPADHDQRHEVKIVNLFRMKGWEASATWILASGKPYTQALGIDTVMIDGEEEYELRKGPRNAERLPMYHRLDLSLSYGFTIKGKWKATVGASVFNVYNRENVKDRNYSFEYPEDGAAEPVELVRIDRHLLGFSPNVFLRFEY